jgi:hypothetical protein
MLIAKKNINRPAKNYWYRQVIRLAARLRLARTPIAELHE